MKTYSETKGHPVFDWRHALSNPLQYLKTDLMLRASIWVTCACGNLCSIIPRYSTGRPKDKELELLGNDFADAVEGNHFNLALSILDKIEARSAFLIAQIEAAK